jgi:hypothetical protein
MIIFIGILSTAGMQIVGKIQQIPNDIGQIWDLAIERRITTFVAIGEMANGAKSKLVQRRH